jgi:hypothetical protein
MNAHYLHGGARWAVLPAISAAGGAFAFLSGKGPDPWTWRLGLVTGLAAGLAVAITPKVSLAPIVALAAGVLGALVVGAVGNRGAADVLNELIQPVPASVVFPMVTALPALWNAFRLGEGLGWSWVNLLLQGLSALAVPAVLWWFNEPVEMETFVPFLILPVGHVVAVEFAAYLCPRRDH